ncbi:MAG TPA: DUF6188 family protein [Gemmatimonadaceae bacterium]|nr:DUF6188 family protein [Gemmatimonadaceae bacterium]
MNAQLIESDDEHHWVLLDHRVTQLVIDRSSIRIQTWSLDGSADIRLAAAFAMQLASGATRHVEPADTERLAPCLALVGLGVRSVTVTRNGTLTLAFSDGSSISASPDMRRSAWDVQGGGILEGMAYAGEPGVELW